MFARHVGLVTRSIALLVPLVQGGCTPEPSPPNVDVSFVLPEDASFTGEVGQYTAQVLYTGGPKNGLLLEATFDPSPLDDAVFEDLPPTEPGETARIIVTGASAADTAEHEPVARAMSGPLSLTPDSTLSLSLFLGRVMAENRLPERLPQPLAGHSATTFPGGETLLAGGSDASGQGLGTTFLFDDGWQSLTFGGITPGPDLLVPRVHHAAGYLRHGEGADAVSKVVILGGDSFVRTRLKTTDGLDVPELDLAAPPPYASVEWLDEIGSRFKEAPALTVGRSYAETVQTSDTSVLLCGGVLEGDSPDDASSIASTCEHWKAEGTSNTFGLHVPRVFHQATLLENGRVLLTGGVSAAGISQDALLPDAELFDPDNPQPELAGLMVLPRAGHVAVLIPDTDGEVLVAGGYTRKPTPSGASYTLTLAEDTEIYLPSTGSQRPFVKGPPLQCPRAFPRAAPIGAGLVLIVGGVGPDGITSPPPELYDRFADEDVGALRLLDPQADCTSSGTTTGDSPLDPTTGPAISLLNDGNLMISGGQLEVGADTLLEGDVLRVFVP